MGARAVAPCMFCGKLPCECNKKPDPKPKAKPVAKPKAEPKPKEEAAPLIPSTPGPMSGKSSPMAGVEYSTSIGSRRTTPVQAPKEKPRDSIMAYAVEVLVLSGLVHKKEMPKLRKLFRPDKTPAIASKLSKWRRRHEDF